MLVCNSKGKYCKLKWEELECKMKDELKKVRKLIIDERIRDVEQAYLGQYFDIIKIPLSDELYDEISGHSDIFYCKINNQIIEAPNAPIHIKNALIGNAKVR